jgi:hypothetical protein
MLIRINPLEKLATTHTTTLALPKQGLYKYSSLLRNLQRPWFMRDIFAFLIRKEYLYPNHKLHSTFKRYRTFGGFLMPSASASSFDVTIFSAFAYSALFISQTAFQRRQVGRGEAKTYITLMPSTPDLGIHMITLPNLLAVFAHDACIAFCA